MTTDSLVCQAGVWALMRLRADGRLTTVDVERLARQMGASPRTMWRWLVVAEGQACHRNTITEDGVHGPDAPAGDTR